MENGRNLKESADWLGREDTGLCRENSSRKYVVITVQVYKEEKLILGQSCQYRLPGKTGI